MSHLTVYRSRDPRVLSVVEEYKDATNLWREKAEGLLAEFGFADRHWVTVSGLGGKRIVGVERRAGEKKHTFNGWRVKECPNMLVLVPDKRWTTGREAAARIEACPPPGDVRSHLPGMPPDHLADHPSGVVVLTPRLLEIDGAVIVAWDTRNLPEIPADRPDPQRRRRSEVDLAIWERVRPSEYHALLEREEAKTNA